MSKEISAVHPVLLFTAPFLFVPTILPGESLTVGRIVMGATGQRGNRFPLALTHHCPLAFTVYDEHRFFYPPFTASGPHRFLVHLLASVGVSCVGRHRMPTCLGPYPQAANPLRRQKGERNPNKYLPHPLRLRRPTAAGQRRRAVEREERAVRSGVGGWSGGPARGGGWSGGPAQGGGGPARGRREAAVAALHRAPTVKP
jgi:hypothetical protein